MIPPPMPSRLEDDPHTEGDQLAERTWIPDARAEAVGGRGVGGRLTLRRRPQQQQSRAHHEHRGEHDLEGHAREDSGRNRADNRAGDGGGAEEKPSADVDEALAVVPQGAGRTR